MSARIAVFASGGGSNLEALLAHLRNSDAGVAEVVLVLSDRADARALTRARTQGIDARHLGDPSDGADMLETLRAHRIDLVVLAGYLKLVPTNVTRAFSGRIVNVHPALLPAFG